MSNLLAIPFKTTYSLDFVGPVRNYLHEQGTHPDAFRRDIAQWQRLRNEAVGGLVHVDRVNSVLRYVCSPYARTSLTMSV